MLQYISYRYSRSSISQTVSVDPLLMSAAAEAVACLAKKKVTELRAALLLNQKHIRNCQQQSRREAASLLKGGLSCHSERKVLAVYALSNWDLSLALRAAQRLSRLPQCSAAFPTSDFVRALFRNHNWEDFVMLHDEGSALWGPARKFARQFLLEHDAWCWVKRQNLSQGVAPSAADVFHYYENKALQVEPCGQPRRRTVNKWAARWRARWGVRRACLRSADTVDPSILRDKARMVKKAGSLFWNPFLVENEGIPGFWGRFLGHKWVAFLGPQNIVLEPFFKVLFATFLRPESSFCQVKAFWRSIAYVTEKFGHQELVWINFDETSVPCCPPCPKGCVVNDWKSYPVPGGPQMPVPKSRRRIAYTYGALLCSHPGIQAVLPHFLVCSEKRLPQTVAKGFAALPPTRLQLLRRKSSWVTTDCMIRILADVREALQPWLPMVKPILVLDTASPHLPKRLMSFAKRKGFQLLFVPASSTGLLQPLDTSAFSAFKHWIKRKNQQLRRTAQGGEPQQLEFLWQLGQAPREFFASRQWAHAFESVGCGRDVTKLHSALRNFMQNPVSFPLPAKPSPAEMALIWPKRRKMSYADACLF